LPKPRRRPKPRLPDRAIAGIRRQHPSGGLDRTLQRTDAIPCIPQLALKPVLNQLDLGDVIRQRNVSPDGAADGGGCGGDRDDVDGATGSGHPQWDRSNRAWEASRACGATRLEAMRTCFAGGPARAALGRATVGPAPDTGLPAPIAGFHRSLTPTDDYWGAGAERDTAASVTTPLWGSPGSPGRGFLFGAPDRLPRRLRPYQTRGAPASAATGRFQVA
jgi:hypothetical protein